MKKRTLLLTALSLGVVAFAAVPSAYAALTAQSTLSQVISAGTLSTDFRNGSNAVVANPTFAMTPTTVSTSSQTTTGTYGTTTARASVDNPGGADSGWVLNLNATTPGTGVWDHTVTTDTYAYNGTATTGQLTVNASGATITPVTGGITGVAVNSTPTAFTGTTAITLMSADASSANIWNGYLTGVSLSQIIPANTPAGTYTLSMTQTLAAV